LSLVRILKASTTWGGWQRKEARVSYIKLYETGFECLWTGCSSQWVDHWSGS
jgi:hypothetical protein